MDRLPADASRGVDVPPAAVRVRRAGRSGGHPPRSWLVYSNPVLLPLPLPDASMPHNVVSFTSTLASVFVGSLLSLLVREHV